MASIPNRLGFIVAIAAAITYADCAGPQQIGQGAFSQPQVDVASTPLPGGVVSRRPSRPLPRDAQSGQPLLYVGNDDKNAVGIFPLTGPNQKRIGKISDGVNGPWGLSIDANNSLYVANTGNRSVTVYQYGSSTPSTTYSTGAREPMYALADSAGHVYVSGREGGYHGFVIEYNVGGKVPIARARLGSEADGIAEDVQGNLYVAYRAYNGMGPGSSIAEFGPRLMNRRHLGMKINQPQGLLVDSAGNIVVVESSLARIDVFPPGATVPSVTLTISGTGHLAQLAMQDSETTLWVSSEGRNVFSMPYPLSQSTVPTEYERTGPGNGIAVTPTTEATE
jgi:hypothetical protein